MTVSGISRVPFVIYLFPIWSRMSSHANVVRRRPSIVNMHSIEIRRNVLYYCSFLRLVKWTFELLFIIIEGKVNKLNDFLRKYPTIETETRKKNVN